MAHVTPDRLEAGLRHVEESPSEQGTVELVVRRPEENEREVLDEAQLDTAVGLVGDMWHRRPSRKGPDGGPNPLAQLTIMNARLAALVAGEKARWPIAGDQLYVDFDLSVDNLPAGSRLAVGAAVFEITDDPHTGCAKFSARFGSDALRFINAPAGRALRLRGANTVVVEPGTVRPGDAVRKL